MLHGIIFSIAFLALLVYSISVTLWARRQKRVCRCGAADGKVHLLDYVLPEREGQPKLARRWTAKDWGKLLVAPPVFRETNIEADPQ